MCAVDCAAGRICCYTLLCGASLMHCAVVQVFLNGGNTMLLCGTGVPFEQTFRQFGSTFRWTMVRLVPASLYC